MVFFNKARANIYLIDFLIILLITSKEELRYYSWGESFFKNLKQQDIFKELRTTAVNRCSSSPTAKASFRGWSTALAGQVCIFSTHSPILMTFHSAEIYELTEDSIRLVQFQDTEHFRITKQFLNAP